MVVLTFVRVGPCQRINICRNRVNLVQPLEAHGQGVGHPVHGEREALASGAEHVAPVALVHLLHHLLHLAALIRAPVLLLYLQMLHSFHCFLSED